MPLQCPDEEKLIDYLENQLPDRQRDRIQSHLAGCFACRDQVAMWIELEQGDALSNVDPVPHAVTQRAIDAVAGLATESFAAKLVERTRRLMAQGKAVVEQLVLGQGAQPVPVRGDQAVVPNQVIQLQKTFSDLDLRIEIEKEGAEQALIRVVHNEEQPPVEPIRVALCKAQREIASMLLDKTPVVFEEIPFGIYALVFIQGGVQKGEYLFELTGTQDTDPKP